MNIKEKREACARFRGWRKYSKHGDAKRSIYSSGAVARGNWKFHCIVANYHPDLDDPESREQANKLWKKLGDDYYWSVENSPCGDSKHFWIMDKKYTTKLNGNGHDILAMGKGPTWNSALVAAVADLEMGKEKDDD